MISQKLLKTLETAVTTFLSVFICLTIHSLLLNNNKTLSSKKKILLLRCLLIRKWKKNCILIYREIKSIATKFETWNSQFSTEKLKINGKRILKQNTAVIFVCRTNTKNWIQKKIKNKRFATNNIIPLANYNKMTIH